IFYGALAHQNPICTGTREGRDLVPPLSAVELADRLHAPRHFVKTLLGDLEADGIVQREGELWRLSLAAEATLGAALRGLTVDDDEDGRYTQCRRHPRYDR